MMFNISLDGGSFSKNLDDFDSIRSVLLYRSVKPIQGWTIQNLVYSFDCIFVKLFCLVRDQRVSEYRRGFNNLVQICRYESTSLHV